MDKVKASMMRRWWRRVSTVLVSASEIFETTLQGLFRVFDFWCYHSGKPFEDAHGSGVRTMI